MVSLSLMGAINMSHTKSDVPESDVIVTPAKKDPALPGENVIVTPATRDEPLPEPEQQGEDRSVSFNDQTYTFPADTTDDEMFEFLNQLPVEGEEEQEPQEPLRERPILKKDEGVRKDKEGKHISYLDTEKILTGGRGHQLTKEEKKLYPKDTVIPDDVVEAWFKADLEEADNDLTELLEEKAVHVPDEVFDVLLNMTFNLGKKGLKGFKKMWKAIGVNDYKTASFEMLKNTSKTGVVTSTKWARQVGDRAIRLADRMAKQDTTKEEQPITAE